MFCGEPFLRRDEFGFSDISSLSRRSERNATDAGVDPDAHDTSPMPPCELFGGVHVGAATSLERADTVRVLCGLVLEKEPAKTRASSTESWLATTHPLRAGILAVTRNDVDAATRLIRASTTAALALKAPAPAPASVTEPGAGTKRKRSTTEVQTPGLLQGQDQDPRQEHASSPTPPAPFSQSVLWFRSELQKLVELRVRRARDSRRWDAYRTVCAEVLRALRLDHREILPIDLCDAVVLLEQARQLFNRASVEAYEHDASDSTKSWRFVEFFRNNHSPTRTRIDVARRMLAQEAALLDPFLRGEGGVPSAEAKAPWAPRPGGVYAARFAAAATSLISS